MIRSPPSEKDPAMIIDESPRIDPSDPPASVSLPQARFENERPFSRVPPLDAPQASSHPDRRTAA